MNRVVCCLLITGIWGLGTVAVGEDREGAPVEPEACPRNVLLDGGFELGAGVSPWDTGGLLCEELCETGGPRTGSGYLWFFGRFTDDVQFVSQPVTITTGGVWTLQFYLAAVDTPSEGEPEGAAFGPVQGNVAAVLGTGEEQIIGNVSVADGGFESGFQLVAFTFEPNEALIGQMLDLQLSNYFLNGGDLIVDDVCLIAPPAVLEGEEVPEGEAAPEGEPPAEGEGTLDGEAAAGGEPPLEGEGAIDGEGPADPIHTLDADGNAAFSLSELLRAIQFYNSNGFGCDTASEDGYGVGDVLTFDCPRHDADYEDPAWALGLSELLRQVQFYNIGGYFRCTEGETDDGFCPVVR